MGYYKKAIQADSMNIGALYGLASIYHAKFILSQYDILLASYTSFYSAKSEELLLKSIDLCKEFNDYRALFYLGELYFINKKYNLASYFLKSYMNNTSKKEYGNNKAVEYYKRCQQLSIWETETTSQSIYNLNNINTNGDEMNAHLSYDGQIIFFSKTYNKPIKNSLFSEFVQEPFYATVIGIDTLNNWIYGSPLPLFSIPDKKIISFYLSSDKKDLYCTACENIRLENDIIEDCDIYKASFNGVDWGTPEPLLKINKENTWEGDPCITADGSSLYFSSNSYESIGGKDIFVCKKNEYGEWDNPVNIGPEINTINDERAPYIHFDQNTLYFSSDGHWGMGGFDFFYSRHIGTNWTLAQNLGKPFNNEEDNIYLCTDARSLTGYFCSRKHTKYGGLDIVTAELPVKYRSKPKMIINIKIIDSKKAQINPKIIIEDVIDGNKITLQQSYNSDFYSAIVDIDKSMFILKLENQGYIYTNKLMQANNQYTIFEKIDLIPIESGFEFDIEDLRFNKENTELSNKSKLILNDFGNYLRSNPIGIEINSCYFSISYGEDNRQIAEKRLENIISYLQLLGISTNRIDGKIVDKFVDKNKDNEYPEVYFKVLHK